MKILGISGGFSPYTWDAAAALIIDNKIIAAAEEERFNRIKFSPGAMPERSINYCLNEGKVCIKDVDFIAFFVSSYKGISKRLKDYFLFRYGYCPKIELVDHHTSHAFSAYAVSGFEDAMVITSDYSGDGYCAGLFEGKKGHVKLIDRIKTPNSLGIFYTQVTRYLGFERGDEYKVMGLSSYGKARYDFSPILDVKNDCYCLNKKTLPKNHYFMPQERNFSLYLEKILGKRRLPEEPVTQKHMDIAASAQRQFECAMIAILNKISKKVSSGNLALAGGSMLNCVSNAKLLQTGLIDNIYVQPASGDSGCSLGAALAVASKFGFKFIKLTSALLGPSFNNKQIENDLKILKCKYRYVENIEKAVAKKIAEGNIIGWFQGRMEFGPRALGGRSILADPTDKMMKDKINHFVKFRESFRPFAPSVIYEEAPLFFKNSYESPFMNLVFDVVKPHLIPSVTHIDKTARVHTVKREENSIFYDLIKEFNKLKGVPVILNTSFNYMGQPIVCTPKEAIYTFYGTGMDVLAIGNFLLEKE